MQEDQKNQWEEQKRQHEVEVIAEKFGMSTASVRAMGTQTGKTRTSDTQSQTNGTHNTSSGTQTKWHTEHEFRYTDRKKNKHRSDANRDG